MNARTKRKAAGLTIVELAKASGVGKGTIIKLERGERIRGDALARLATTLGCVPDDLEPWVFPGGVEDDRVFRLIADRWTELGPETKGRVVDLVLNAEVSK